MCLHPPVFGHMYNWEWIGITLMNQSTTKTKTSINPDMRQMLQTAADEGLSYSSNKYMRQTYLDILPTCFSTLFPRV